jgi:hypothetical protein
MAKKSLRTPKPKRVRRKPLARAPIDMKVRITAADVVGGRVVRRTPSGPARSAEPSGPGFVARVLRRLFPRKAPPVVEMLDGADEYGSQTGEVVVIERTMLEPSLQHEPYTDPPPTDEGEHVVVPDLFAAFNARVSDAPNAVLRDAETSNVPEDPTGPAVDEVAEAQTYALAPDRAIEAVVDTAVAITPPQESAVPFSAVSTEIDGWSAFFAPLDEDEKAEVDAEIPTESELSAITWIEGLHLTQAPPDPAARVKLVHLAATLGLRDVLQDAEINDPHPRVRESARAYLDTEAAA